MREQPFKRISVIGLGYIGLPTAAMFASRKIEVIGVDVDQTAVDTINDGDIHIVEPDLDMVVHAAVHEGYLRATTKPEPAEVFLIAVPTPFKGDSFEPDLSYVESASRSIAPVLEPGNLVILESTSPIGTTEAMAGWLAAERPDLSFPQSDSEACDILIAHCPERVLPGKVLQELITNDRVIGGITEACSAAAVALYKTFVAGECWVASGPRVAEMAKLTENSFRDVNIAFANELSMVCSTLGINVWELITLANRHPRVNVLRPGPGVGGHCIAVDPWFIVASAPEQARLIRTARKVNDSKPAWVVDQVTRAMGDSLLKSPHKTVMELSIACYGLAFKADIDDLRESPALQVVEEIASVHPGAVVVVEPYTKRVPSSLRALTNAELVQATKPVAADIHVLLVAHSEFKSWDWKGVDGTVLDFQGLM